MRRLPWKNFCFIIVMSLAAAINIKLCINVPEDTLTYTNSITAFLLWAGWTFALRKITAGEQWGEIKEILNPCFVFLLCFVGSMIAGVSLDRQGAVDFGDWHIYIAALCISTAAAPILAWLVRKLNTYGLKGQDKPAGVGARESCGGRKYFFFIWGLLFLAYIPTFLASFPGFFVYDAETEAYMVFTEKYSAHHPVLHVLLLGWMLRIVHGLTQSYNAGIALYILLQIIFLSGCFAYMMNFLKSIGVKRWICNVGTVFLALFPTVSMFVCCSTKDGIFAGGVVLLTTLLLEMARDGEAFWTKKCKRAGVMFSMLLILFFRNNGIYALVFFLIPFAFLYRKMWRKWIVPIVGAFLIFGSVTGVLKYTFHFTEGEMAEMLCVPMQQLARAYTYEKDGFTEEELELLYSLIPESILEKYNPKLADNIKVNFLEDNFKGSPGRYVSLWARIGWRYPDIYINSFLANTYGYWYPDTVLDGYKGKTIVERVYGDSSYFAFETERPGIRMHLLPWLENFYEKISLEIYQQKLPVISMLFSIGFWHWCYAFLAFYLLLIKCGKQAFSLAVMGLLYLTVLLGPIALVRYILYFFFAVPLLLALLFDTKTVAGDCSFTQISGK